MKEYAQKALQLSQKIRFKSEEGNAFLNLGISNIITGDYSKALDYFSKAKLICCALTGEQLPDITNKGCALPGCLNSLLD